MQMGGKGGFVSRQHSLQAGLPGADVGAPAVVPLGVGAIN